MKIDYIVDPHKYLLMPGFLELSITLKIVRISITRAYAHIYVYVYTYDIRMHIFSIGK